MGGQARASGLEGARNGYQFERDGDGHYRLVVTAHSTVFDVDRLWRDRDELKCELVVTTRLHGAQTIDGCLSSGNFNLSSIRARHERARQLLQRARTGNAVDWETLVDEVCIRVIDAERAGQPARLLHEYPRPAPDDTLVIDGVPLLRKHPVMFFGDGGTLKSYLGLYFAGRLAQRKLPVLYADWELGGEDHRERLERLFGLEMPHVHYVRCDRPITAEVDRLRRCVEQIHAAYVLCDSVAYAAGGAPESAEIAAAYFRAIRQFGPDVGSLHIAHITKPREEDKERPTNQKPFGSVFWHNSARATWHVKSARTDEQKGVAIGLYNQKANLGPLADPVGFEVEFDSERTIIRRIDLSTVSDLAVGLPLRLRIPEVLKCGTQTIAEIADELGAKPDTVHKVLTRGEGKTFVRLTNTADGVQRWGLLH
jgi:hypothetical protein